MGHFAKIPISGEDPQGSGTAQGTQPGLATSAAWKLRASQEMEQLAPVAVPKHAPLC
ncbi:hypothetical protein GCM10010302_06480 [Streptomyces polychromogenes]|uniref:Uncharacterized protein n=1 Tax=Streptomyces polychromogenes TaxID=67342 RepID=A0ABN0V2A9_9ACTN